MKEIYYILYRYVYMMRSRVLLMRRNAHLSYCALNMHTDVKYEIFVSSCVVGFIVPMKCVNEMKMELVDNKILAQTAPSRAESFCGLSHKFFRNIFKKVVNGAIETDSSSCCY